MDTRAAMAVQEAGAAAAESERRIRVAVELVKRVRQEMSARRVMARIEGRSA